MLTSTGCCTPRSSSIVEAVSASSAISSRDSESMKRKRRGGGGLGGLSLGGGAGGRDRRAPLRLLRRPAQHLFERHHLRSRALRLGVEDPDLSHSFEIRRRSPRSSARLWSAVCRAGRSRGGRAPPPRRPREPPRTPRP